MLMPKRTKFRRMHRPKVRRIAKRGYEIAFGDFALKALEGGWITSRQIEAARVAMTRKMRRDAKIWIRIFPDRSITRKPQEVRMGKGKGLPEYWVAPVEPGRILFEASGVARELAEEAMRLAQAKLPIKTKFIVRRDYEGS
jgi:large subunit ribosomal protein L16|nr:MAG: 50S ribosomal protein L16 [Bacteroidota bacterium]